MAHMVPSSNKVEAPGSVSQPTLAELYASLATKESEIRSSHAYIKALDTLLEDDKPTPERRAWIEHQIAEAKSLIRIAQLMTQLYREWASKLSRGMIRQVGILNLPEELLVRIFEQVEDCRPDEHESYTWTRALDDIRAVRLTCRRFCNASSHLLVHDVHVYIDHASLDHLEKIATHPAVGRGVRAVVVRCDVYLPQPANDLQIFARWARGSLERAAGIKDEYMYKDWDEKAASNHEEWRSMVHTYNKCVASVRVYEEHHQKLVEEAHEEYKRRFAEQQGLIARGTYANKLAALIASLPNARRLVLTDRVIQRPERWRKRLRRDLFTDDEWLKQQFVLPLSPAEVILETSLWFGPPEYFSFPQDTLIRLGERGVQLRQLDVDLSVNLLAAPASTPSTIIRHEKVSALVSRLNELTIYLRLIHNETATPTTKFCLDGLMSSLLSCIPCLAKLSLGGSDVPGHPLYNISRAGGVIGPAIAGREFPRLKELMLDGCDFDVPELQALMDGLSPTIWVKHDNTVIRNGSWVKALDVLRLWRQKAQGNARLSVSRPKGGGLLTGGDDDEYYIRLVRAGKYLWMGHEELKEELQAYVDGEIVENPLLEDLDENPLFVDPGDVVLYSD